ncbi:golgin subfamily A member 6-like protein 6 isoform X2 [Bradysia coprophila]|uniref:golgin subfamily A member 6-like protein 6 isoform X2 n=1 Tax=Bradysia coprophila TaxID=38358 RepID=UPI00187DB3C6|nr:golgin subfamily A member 6-like protein 6 isoform X2 [Bradysia coprophila]
MESIQEGSKSPESSVNLQPRGAEQSRAKPRPTRRLAEYELRILEKAYFRTKGRPNKFDFIELDCKLKNLRLIQIKQWFRKKPKKLGSTKIGLRTINSRATGKMTPICAEEDVRLNQRDLRSHSGQQLDKESSSSPSEIHVDDEDPVQHRNISSCSEDHENLSDERLGMEQSRLNEIDQQQNESEVVGSTDSDEHENLSDERLGMEHSRLNEIDQQQNESEVVGSTDSDEHENLSDERLGMEQSRLNEIDQQQNESEVVGSTDSDEQEETMKELETQTVETQQKASDEEITLWKVAQNKLEVKKAKLRSNIIDIEKNINRLQQKKLGMIAEELSIDLEIISLKKKIN